MIGLIVLKLALLPARWDQPVGYDVWDFLPRVVKAAAGDYDPPLKSSYWAYHPPLGFAMSGWIMRTGRTDLSSVQIVATLAACVFVVALRGALAAARLHRKPAGFCMLALAASTPLFVHSGTTVNIDIVACAFGTVALWASARLWWAEGRIRWPWALLLVAALVAGLMTKFSALLWFGVPPFVAFVAADEMKVRVRRASAAIGLCAVAALCVLPYYYTRYYRETGAFFPSANDWWIPGDLAAAKQVRDSDVPRFLKEFFGPSEAAATHGLNVRDLEYMHLGEAWRDFWVQPEFLAPVSISGVAAGAVYWSLAPLLIALGALQWRPRSRELWHRLGWVVLCFAAVEWGALASYAWTQPLAPFSPTKGIYIMPALLLPAYFIANLANTSHPRMLALGKVFRNLAVPAAIAIALLNHLLPVY